LFDVGKHRALSREVTCNFRLYLEIGQTSVNPILNDYIYEKLALSTHMSTL